MFNIKYEIDRIIKWLTEYKETTNCKGVVLGISGGKDSTVVAMLAKKIWGENVFGVLMPNGIQKDIVDSKNVVETLNIKHKVVNIEDAFAALIDEIETFVDFQIQITDKAKTNIPPRLRMTTLYAIAQSLGYRVIGTGNASEAYIGWTTKWGDSAYDLNPIYHLTCSEVIEIGKELCKEFNLPEELVVKKPSDGLTGKSDEDNFGFTYADLDNWIKEGLPGEKIETINMITNLHKTSEHKRNMPLTMKK